MIQNFLNIGKSFVKGLAFPYFQGKSLDKVTAKIKDLSKNKIKKIKKEDFIRKVTSRSIWWKSFFYSGNDFQPVYCYLFVLNFILNTALFFKLYIMVALIVTKQYKEAIEVFDNVLIATIFGVVQIWAALFNKNKKDTLQLEQE